MTNKDYKEEPLMRKLIAIIIFMGGIWIAGCKSGATITSLEPSFGNVAGNDQINIIGNGFKAGIEVQFGKRAAKNVVIVSPTRITVKTPSGVEGKVDVTITLDDGRTLFLENGFTYRRDAPSGQ